MSHGDDGLVLPIGQHSSIGCMHKRVNMRRRGANSSAILAAAVVAVLNQCDHFVRVERRAKVSRVDHGLRRLEHDESVRAETRVYELKRAKSSEQRVNE